MSLAPTPWATGRLGRVAAFRKLAGHRKERLLFGATYEDPHIEREALRDCHRVFCIVGAGDTARALAVNGHKVFAVDVNNAQIQYAQSRTDGQAFTPGAAERIMQFGRFLMKAGGWSASDVNNFVKARTISEQMDMWSDLTTGRGGAVLRTLLAPARLASVFQPAFVLLVGPKFADRLIETLTRSLSETPNQTNPFVRLLFLGEGSSAQSVPPGNRPTFKHVDAISYLRSQPAGSFDGASLSNIGDGTNAAFHRELDAALRHAVNANGPVVVRTMGDVSTLGSTTMLGTLAPLQNDAPDAERIQMVQCAAATDRSLIWAGLEVQRNTVQPASEI